MQTFEKIEFRRKRDFGEIFNDSFSFLKQNLKPLAKALIVIAGPLYLGGAMLMLFTQNFMGMGGGSLEDFGMTSSAFFFIFMGLAFLLSIGGAALQFATIIAYFKVYFETTTGEITVGQVWDKAKNLVFPLIGLSILVSLLTMAGGFLCLIPGIYVMVALSFSFYILGMEGKSVTSSFSRSFDLMSGNWWSTFLVILVMGIIVIVISVMVSVPLELLGIIVQTHTLFDAFEVPESSIGIMRIVYWLYAPVSSLIEMLLRTLPMMAICLKYFSVVEEKESVGLMEQIAEIDQLDDQAPE